MNIIKRGWNWALSRFFRRLADAHRHFGNQYSNRREYEAAISNYTRAASRDPSYTYVVFSRGVLHWREFGDYPRAIQDLTRVLELDPSYAKAYLNRGLAFKMQKEYDRAIADFEHYLEVGTDDFWLEAARIQLAELHGETSEGSDT